jgi:hypothetical protein
MCHYDGVCGQQGLARVNTIGCANSIVEVQEVYEVYVPRTRFMWQEVYEG